METKHLTWKKLADEISKMTEKQQNEPVKIWGEDITLGGEISLNKEDEDLCCDLRDPEMGCDCRSSFGEKDDLTIVLPANTYYLWVED